MLVALAATSTIAAVAAGPATAGAQPAGTEGPATRRQLTLRDSLYLLPLRQPSASPQCLLILCPLIQALSPVGSGPDAGVSGLQVTGLLLAPPGVTAESRSEPLPYDGAGEDGTASVQFSVDRRGDGSGGSATTEVLLQDTDGGTVARLPSSPLPLDGTRRSMGTVSIDPKALIPGHSYVAVVRFALSTPPGSSVTARVYAPQLLALGPTKAPKAPAALKPRAPVVTLLGRRLRVVAKCPAGSARCDVEARSSLRGKTVGKGGADIQAGSEHTFTFRLTAAELRRARRVGRIATAVRVQDEKGRVGVARSTLRVPRH
ncbi:hypothetical protein AB0L40_25560 [Patulibacter sp. NPDC049589]|uniref:hypothetical protein n=1 Tax=Patulibacter sp. NPDC049589 TaxID=3154731 RepID=UPI0034478531